MLYIYKKNKTKNTNTHSVQPELTVHMYPFLYRAFTFLPGLLVSIENNLVPAVRKTRFVYVLISVVQITQGPQ